jgi:hypothetical protein
MTPDSTGGTRRHDDEQPDPSGDSGRNDPLDSSNEGSDRVAEVPDEGGEFDDAEVVEEYVDADVQSRLWLRAVVPLLQLRSHETDPNGRVQFAFDLMYIAACERIARILRSDIASDRS